MNRENFQRVLDQIKAHPETWEQEKWHTACGTAHCFAGWSQNFKRGFIPAPFSDLSSGDVTKRDACDFLQIDASQAAFLFLPWRTISDFEVFLRHDGDMKKVYKDVPK